MKEIGDLLVTVGIMYAAHTLVGTQPNVEAWWAYIIIGSTFMWFGNWRAGKASRQRREEYEKYLQRIRRADADAEARFKGQS